MPKLVDEYCICHNLNIIGKVNIIYIYFLIKIKLNYFKECLKINTEICSRIYIKAIKSFLIIL